MPPHLFLLAAVGVSLVAGYRLAHWSMKRHRQQDAMRQAEENQNKAKEPKEAGTLEWDEASGAYKPEPKHH